MLTVKGCLEDINIEDASVGDIYKSRETGGIIFCNSDKEFTPLSIENVTVANDAATTLTLRPRDFGYIDICSPPREERIVKNTKCNCCDGKLPMEKADDRGLVKCEYCGNWNSIY